MASSKRSKRADRWHISLEDLGKLRLQMVRHLHVTAFLTIPRDQNVLMGEREICAYLKLRHATTLQRLIEHHAFPVVPTSDGALMSTCTMIDQWMWLQSQLKQRNKPLTKREEQKLRKIDAIRHDLGMETWGEMRKKKGPKTEASDPLHSTTEPSTQQRSLTRSAGSRTRASSSRAGAATVEHGVRGGRADTAVADAELHRSVLLGLPGVGLDAASIEPVGGRSSGDGDCTSNQGGQDSDTHSVLHGVTRLDDDSHSIDQHTEGAKDDNSTHQAARAASASTVGCGTPRSDQGGSPNRSADRPPRGYSYIERARSLFELHGTAIEDGE